MAGYIQSDDWGDGCFKDLSMWCEGVLGGFIERGGVRGEGCRVLGI